VKRTYIDPRTAPPVTATTLRRIVHQLHPYRWHVSLVAASMVVCALLNLIPPILIKQLVDKAIPRRDLHLLVMLCLGMVAGPLLAGLFQVGQKYLSSWIGERVMYDMRVELFRHLHRQSLGFFSSAKPGEAVSRVLNDVKGVGDVLSSTLINAIQNAIVLTSTAALLFVFDWRLALVAVGLLPIFVIPTRRVGLTRKSLRRTAQAKTAEITGILLETLSVSGALLLKVFGTEDKETERFRAKAAELMEVQLRQALIGRWFQMLLGLFENAGPALVFAVGGWLVITGHAELGTIIAFVTQLRRLYSSSSDTANLHVDMVVSYAYFDRVFQVLDMVPEIVDAPGAIAVPVVKGHIAFRHVSFSYGEDDRTLVDFNLTIPPGGIVAVVGPSGAGKSTLAGLVPRLWDPTDGAVTLDGVDIRRIQLESLRSHIAVVTQETFLFHASVADNIRYGRESASFDEIVRAAKAAQIHDLIASLPDGYDTTVGDRGFRFSGGERQRLAIARAILKNAQILILDEATSALDSANEALVQQALEPLFPGRTSLVIAHRLSTIRKADLIVVLQNGRVVERGRHHELLALKGLYRQLHEEQTGQDI
jgi:ATP-binding cassette subfamily B protein